MNKIIVAAIAVVVGGQALFMGAGSAQALSCLPVDMYLNEVVKEETGETLVFTGTATAVTANHTQVVTVTEAHKGWVAPKVWVQHPYSTDWQYFCSHGPAKAGEPTVFLVRVDGTTGTFSVTQTLTVNSAEAKSFIQALEKEETDAGITEATAEDREAEVQNSIMNLLTQLLNLLQELKYWEGQTK